VTTAITLKTAVTGVLYLKIIVGKPVFIWMSWDTNGKGFNKIRWDRVFTTVSGDGQPQSYFNIFNRIGRFFVGEYFGKKKRKKTSSLKFQV
jgi:signal peptidase I